MKGNGPGLCIVAAAAVQRSIALLLCLITLRSSCVKACEYDELLILDTFEVNASEVDTFYWDLFIDLDLEWYINEEEDVVFTNLESSELETCEGANPFTVADGNVTRRIDDLAVGVTGLTFRRFHNSKERASFSAFPLGNGGNWRHNWQFDLISTISPDHGDVLEFCYPDGRRIFLQKQNSTSYHAPDGTPESATVSSNGEIDLLLADGSSVKFALGQKFRKGEKFRAISISTVNGNDIRLSSDAAGKLMRVEDTEGNWLQLTYSDVKLSGNPYKDLLTIKKAPLDGAPLEIDVPVAATENAIGLFVRIPAGAAVSEVQFFAEGSTVPFSGTPGNEYCQAAIDGDMQSVFKADSTRRTIGYLFPSESRVRLAKVKVFAAPGEEAKLLESKLVVKAARGQDETISVISKVAGSNGRSTTYDYDISDQTHGYQASLSKAYYGDGTQAEYRYSKRSDFFGGDALLVEADDPRYAGPAKHIAYSYYRSKYDGLAAGTIKHELNPKTRQPWASLEIDPKAPLARRVNYSDDRTRTYVLKSDGSGRVEKKVDGLGREKTFSYSDGKWGRRTEIAGSGTEGAKVLRDKKGRVVATFRNGEKVAEITHDDRGRLIRRSAGGNEVMVVDRDSKGRVTRIEQKGIVHELTRDAKGRVIARKSPRKTLNATYDAKGRLRSIVDAAGATKTLDYDEGGFLGSVTGPLGKVTRFERSERGLVTAIVHSDGSRREFTYDKYGRRTSETDGLGRKIEYEHDELSRRTKLIDAFGGVTRYDYSEFPNGCSSCSASSHPTKVTHPSGAVTAFLYDSEGRMISKTSAVGTMQEATYTYSYDDSDNLVKITDPLGKKTEFAYDDKRRKISQTDPLGRTTKWDYTSANCIWKFVNANGGVTAYEYDDAGHRIAAQDPAGNTIRFAYNGANKVTSVTDPLGSVYRLEYDQAGRRTKLIYPDGTRESWTYNAAGQAVTFSNRSGQTKAMDYDSSGRLLSEKWSSNSSEPQVYTYTPSGLMSSVANGSVRLDYSYDSLGRLLNETTSVANTSWTVSYGYAPGSGRIVSTRYPSGFNIERNRTSDGYLVGMKAEGRPIAAYTYDIYGRRTRLDRDDGLSSKWEWDSVGQLLSVSHSSSKGILSETDYGYSVLGERLFKTAGHSTIGYHYNAAGQLTEAKAFDADNNRTLMWSESYEYDQAGNRKRHSRFDEKRNGQKSRYDQKYSTNSLNQYSTIAEDAGSVALTYDSNGNLTAYGDLTFKFDAKNRLLEASSNSERLTQIFDSWGRVVLRRYYTKAQGDWKELPDKSRFISYDSGWNVLEEKALSGNWLRRYLRDGHSEDVIRIDVVRGQEVRSYYPLIDGLGSTVAVADSANRIVAEIEYDPFGKKTVKGEEMPFVPAFTGRIDIEFAGLQDHRRRLYSPDLGRWSTSDPSGFAGGLNLYAYALNNPITGIDLDGLATIQYRPLIGTDAKLAAWLVGYDPVHYTIFLNDGLVPPNASYGDGGVVQESDAKKCLYAEPGPGTYNDAIMRKAIDNVKKSGDWDATDYGNGHTCHEFIDAVLDEYNTIANDPNLTQEANDEQATRVAAQGG